MTRRHSEAAGDMYDAAGRLTGIAHPNGVSSTLGYDIADRLTSISHDKGGTNLEAIQYVVNAVGNRTSMTDSAGTTSWSDDTLDRLTNVVYPGTDATAYGYDAERPCRRKGNVNRRVTLP